MIVKQIGPGRTPRPGPDRSRHGLVEGVSSDKTQHDHAIVGVVMPMCHESVDAMLHRSGATGGVEVQICLDIEEVDEAVTVDVCNWVIG